MTHALHRLGPTDSLMRDYHLLGMVSRKASNEKGVDQLRKFFRVVVQVGAVNVGVSRKGSIFLKTSYVV